MKSPTPDHPDSAPPEGTSGSMVAFLNSSLGVLLIGSLIGAAGLFTWQRQDWLFKENYHRNQVMLDRRLNLLEQINRDTGHLVAAADDLFAAYAKGVSQEQKNQIVQAYNTEEVKWFGSYGAKQALLAFYFPGKDVTDKFAEIVGTSRELDLHLDSVWKGSESPAQGAEISEKIRRELEALNRLALQRLLSL